MREKKLTFVVGLTIAMTAGALITLAVGSPLAAHGDAAEAKEKIYVVEGDVQKPVRLSGDAPGYPDEAKKERAEGIVVVRTVIDREGKVASTEIVESEREDLGDAAVAAIETWTFEPATLAGEPVPVYYHLTVRFRLDPEKPAKDDAG